jgi:hypothetical protein
MKLTTEMINYLQPYQIDLVFYYQPSSIKNQNHLFQRQFHLLIKVQDLDIYRYLNRYSYTYSNAVPIIFLMDTYYDSE